MKRLLKWLSMALQEPEPRAVYHIGGGWGNHIHWLDFKRGVIYGHMSYGAPEKGDHVLSEMKSGNTARFKITSMDWQGDPPDMFFADVSFISYEPVPADSGAAE